MPLAHDGRPAATPAQHSGGISPAARTPTALITQTLDLEWTITVVTAARMETYLRHHQHQVDQRQQAPATYNKRVAALAAFGHWLVATGVVADNPARRLRRIPEQPQPIRTLLPRVLHKLLDAAHHTGDLRDAVIIELLAYTGMRAHEVAAIQLADLTPGQRTTWLQVIGKGAKHRRIPLPKHVGQLIVDYLAWRTVQEGHRPTAGALLVGERGGITRTTINRTVAAVAHQAHLSPAEQAHIPITPHAFRHTVATRIARTRDLVTAADVLGHGNLATTRRYTKASAEEVVEALEHLYDDGPEQRH